jgi:hypothetical protein
MGAEKDRTYDRDEFRLFIMHACAIFFIPAAATRTYGVFLTGLFVMGTGLALLQTASNPYITIWDLLKCGTEDKYYGNSNKSAGIIATFLFGVMALNDGDELVAKLRTLEGWKKNLMPISLRRGS